MNGWLTALVRVTSSQGARGPAGSRAACSRERVGGLLSGALAPRLAAVLAVGLALGGGTPVHAAPAISLVPAYRGLAQPLQVTYAPGDTERIFIVEQVGRVRVGEGGVLRPEPLLDLRGEVSTASERGLLGLAFHPRFQENGFVYVNLTNRRGDTEVRRYRVDPRTYRADPASMRLILSIPQPAANHNGGMMAFGPDGYLYIATGDGGRAGDPWGNAQNLGSLLGKILRIDVDRGDPYAVPADNPFAGGGGRPEIWAYGLRNPWRFSFDRATGDLYIADVGQNRWEEVNRQPAGSAGGENYGWNRLEGNHCYPRGEECDRTGLTPPIAEYAHDRSGGCSVTGGYVYRGREVPALAGWYLYGDYCSGTIWGFDTRSLVEGVSPEPSELLQTNALISSFGEDAQGEVYITDQRSGTVFKVGQ